MANIWEGQRKIMKLFKTLLKSKRQRLRSKVNSESFVESVRINTLVDVHDPNSALLGDRLHNKNIQRSSTRFNNSNILKNNNSLLGGELISGSGNSL